LQTSRVDPFTPGVVVKNNPQREHVSHFELCISMSGPISPGDAFGIVRGETVNHIVGL
jgi:hypothetical protein